MRRKIISAVQTRILFGAVLGVLILSPVSSLASCMPTSGGKSCFGAFCDQLGQTVMDSNNKNLLACMSVTPNNDSCLNNGCVWKAMGESNTGKSTRFLLTQATLHQYHIGCSPSLKFEFCASACSRYCNDGCSVEQPIVYDPPCHAVNTSRCCDSLIKNGNKYTSGVFGGWDASKSTGTCVCYY